MPMSRKLEERLYPILPKIVHKFGTPFHIYDEQGIIDAGNKLKDLFCWARGFQEFFAVKALPNPAILRIIHDLHFGFDASSIPELILARSVGASPEEIMFTSNNTVVKEFDEASKEGGCILNLDDITLIDKVPVFPDLICFRYNPGKRRTGNDIIGKPQDSKYGVTHDQIVEGYAAAMKRGAKRFGLHTMIISNELNYSYMTDTVRMLLELVEEISQKLSIAFEFINMGGGIGIPYRPDDKPFDFKAFAQMTRAHFEGFERKHGYVPKLFMELGRFMTGPHGVLVATVINRMQKYRTLIGVDACMSSLMRPAMYGAYHHITILDREGTPKKRDEEIVDVVGSLCENNDKFASKRLLPKALEGDLCVIHDAGAHGQAMGFNYNGRLRPQELLLSRDGSIELIRRAETVEDYFRTMTSFYPKKRSK